MYQAQDDPFDIKLCDTILSRLKSLLERTVGLVRRSAKERAKMVYNVGYTHFVLID